MFYSNIATIRLLPDIFLSVPTTLLIDVIHNIKYVMLLEFKIRKYFYMFKVQITATLRWFSLKKQLWKVAQIQFRQSIGRWYLLSLGHYKLKMFQSHLISRQVGKKGYVAEIQFLNSMKCSQFMYLPNCKLYTFFIS